METLSLSLSPCILLDILKSTAQNRKTHLIYWNTLVMKQSTFTCETRETPLFELFSQWGSVCGADCGRGHEWSTLGRQISHSHRFYRHKPEARIAQVFFPACQALDNTTENTDNTVSHEFFVFLLLMYDLLFCLIRCLVDGTCFTVYHNTAPLHPLCSWTVNVPLRL